MFPLPICNGFRSFDPWFMFFPFVLFCLDRKTLCQFPKRVDFLCAEWDSGACNTIMHVYVVYGFSSSNLKYWCCHLSVIKTAKKNRRINDNCFNHYLPLTSLRNVTYQCLLHYFYLHLIIYSQIYLSIISK